MTQKSKKVGKEVLITGMICITGLTTLALLLGYNGTLLALVIGLLGIAIGLPIKSPIK